MAKVLYTPFGIVAGLIGGLLARSVFMQVWKAIAGEDDPPTPRQSEYSWKEILGAAALQGAIFSVVKAVVNRGGAKGFQKLTGSWPGD
jgi:TRAP-type C4-dicarboxylate transport system permease large subunit